MNERIRELWTQAGGHYNSGNQHTWPEYIIDDPEKFALLIVRECIAKAEEEAERYLGFPNLENADMYAKVMYNYQELLKEHFGVEE
jgi:hypothetical protein